MLPSLFLQIGTRDEIEELKVQMALSTAVVIFAESVKELAPVTGRSEATAVPFISSVTPIYDIKLYQKLQQLGKCNCQS
jgi:hypothetical protein